MKRTLGITILLLVGAMAVQSQGRPSGAFQYSGSSWVAAAASSITGQPVDVYNGAVLTFGDGSAVLTIPYNVVPIT